jgi:hypothetical protein
LNEINIANLALGYCGKGEIISLEDPSREARLCKSFYAPALDAVLEDRLWSFAKKQYVLIPLAGAPLFLYERQFQLPSEVIRVHNVTDEWGDPTLEWEKQGRLLLSNATKLYVTAVFRSMDTDAYSANFKMALAARLAAELAIPLTQNRTLQVDLVALAAEKLKDASGTDGAQGKSERPKRSWVHDARR